MDGLFVTVCLMEASPALLPWTLFFPIHYTRTPADAGFVKLFSFR